MQMRSPLFLPVFFLFLYITRRKRSRSLSDWSTLRPESAYIHLGSRLYRCRENENNVATTHNVKTKRPTCFPGKGKLPSCSSRSQDVIDRESSEYGPRKIFDVYASISIDVQVLVEKKHNKTEARPDVPRNVSIPAKLQRATASREESPGPSATWPRLLMI